jgi:F0F1-type ATP synthase membrane subunit b/b'
VYLFVSRVFVPRMDQIFSDREFHIESIKKTACLAKEQAVKTEKSTEIELENAQISIEETESRIVSNLREQTLREKKSLYNSFSEKSKSESEFILQSSDEVFIDTVNNIDELVNAAMISVFRPSAEKKQ